MFVSYFNGFETKKKSKYKVDFNFIIISFKKDKTYTIRVGLIKRYS